MYVCACSHVCVGEGVVCIERAQSLMVRIFIYCFPYYFLRQSPSLSLVLTDWLDGWPANSRDPSISVPSTSL